MSKTFIARVQRGLTALGYDLGPADGIAGDRTERGWAALEGRLGIGTPTPFVPPVAPAPVASGVIRQGSAGYTVDEIVVHCSATRPDWFAGRGILAKRAEIRRWHVEDNGWRDIGYHWVIDRDGAEMAGRAETEIGSGVMGHNRGVIHVCLFGGHGSDASDKFAEHFTPEQDATLRARIADIRSRTPIRRVSGHNEHAAKACPGFNVPRWLG